MKKLVTLYISMFLAVASTETLADFSGIRSAGITSASFEQAFAPGELPDAYIASITLGYESHLLFTEEASDLARLTIIFVREGSGMFDAVMAELQDDGKFGYCGGLGVYINGIDSVETFDDDIVQLRYNLATKILEKAYPPGSWSWLDVSLGKFMLEQDVNYIARASDLSKWLACESPSLPSIVVKNIQFLPGEVGRKLVD